MRSRHEGDTMKGYFILGRSLRGDRLRGVLFLLAYAAFLIFVRRYCLIFLPNTGDEHSILFQAKIFAHLRAWAPAPPPCLSSAPSYIEIANGKWFSQYPPLYSLLLAPGLWLGSTTWVQIPLALLMLGLLQVLLRRLGIGPKSAWALAAAFGMSPSFIFQSVSYYTHLPALVLTLGMLLSYLRFEREASPQWAFWLSLCLGLGLQIRPYTFLLLSAPLAIDFLMVHRKESLGIARRCSLAGLAPILTSALFYGIWNFLLYGRIGSVASIPYAHAGDNLAKFSWSGFSWPGLWRALGMLEDTYRWLLGLGWFGSGDLKEKAVGDVNLGLWLGALSAVYWCRRAGIDESHRRMTLLLMSLVISAWIGHMAYPLNGGRYGERLLFEVSWILFLAVAMMFIRVFKSRRIPLMVWILTLYSWHLPATLSHFRKSNLRRMDPYLQTESPEFADAAVLLRSVPEWTPRWYARNDPFLRGTQYAAWDRSDSPKLLEREYPGKTIYVYDWDESRGRGLLARKRN